MPTGNLKVAHSFAGETDYIIMVITKSTAPLADVVCIIDGILNQTRKVYPAPHTQESLLIEALDAVWYNLKFYRSTDGVALDTELLTLAGNAVTGAIYSTTKYEYMVDRGDGDATPGSAWSDPVSESIELRDERLKDKIYFVHERNTGLLMDAETLDRSDLGGGFDLTEPDKTFEPDAKYIVLVINLQNIPSDNPTSGSNEYNDVFILDEDQDFDPAEMFGKVLISDWLTTVGTISFQDLATMPDGKFKLLTHHGLQRNVVLQFNFGNTIRFRGEDVNKITFGKSEMIEILFRENVAYVIDDKTDHGRLGERTLVDRLGVNQIALNGTQYNQADVPRIMELLETLDAAEIVSEAVWSATTVVDGDVVAINKGKYARTDGPGTPTVRVPDDRNMYYRAMKYLDGTVDGEKESQGVGGYMHDKVHSHKHTAAAGWYWYGAAGRGNLSANDDAVRNEPSNRSNDALQNFGGTETRTVGRSQIPALNI